VAGPVGPPIELRDWPTANGCPQRIPDRHIEDLFVGVRVEGFERQSAFRYRDDRNYRTADERAVGDKPHDSAAVLLFGWRETRIDAR
jgi:hypothetical protein